MTKIRTTIKQVLNDFFPNENSDGFDDSFLVSHLDEEDKQLLASALTEALEKVVKNESRC